MKRTITLIMALALVVAFIGGIAPQHAYAAEITFDELHTDNGEEIAVARRAPALNENVEDVEPMYEEIPLYNQLDYPHIPYSQGSVATSGCGITCLAMIASYMLQEEYLPDELALAYNASADNNVSRMENAAKDLGLKFEKVYGFTNNIMPLLKEGKTMIALMNKNSIFTNYGHFIVLNGMTEDGKIRVLDPNGANYELYPEEFENGFEWGRVCVGFGGAWVFEDIDVDCESIVVE